MKIRFLGATGTVTGSRYLVSSAKTRLLVDCGLFQGVKTLRLKNWRSFPHNPAELDAVVLTHAHLDHSGFLPRLMREGFRGRIYCTPATRDLAAILLPDSGQLQEAEAERANRHGYSKHHPAEPLYTANEAEAVLKQLHPQAEHKPFTIGDMQLSFTPAGHILGAACVRIVADGKALTFSGDVGRANDPIMRPPEPLSATDFLVLESTYGDRRHSSENVKQRLGQIVRETAAHGGTLLVPAFAVGRAQSLLHLLTELRAAGDIPALPVYLDSPMAIDVSHVLHRYRAQTRLSKTECDALCGGATYVRDSSESKQLMQNRNPKIIVAGAGMLTGGRILHHLKAFGGDHRSCLIITGYQAEGTRGRALLNGNRTLKVYGDYVTVNCQLETLDSLSGHADYVELGDWLSHMTTAPKRIFITHGEPAAADHLRRYLGERFGWAAEVPEEKDEELLD